MYITQSREEEKQVEIPNSLCDHAQVGWAYIFRLGP